MLALSLAGLIGIVAGATMLGLAAAARRRMAAAGNALAQSDLAMLVETLPAAIMLFDQDKKLIVQNLLAAQILRDHHITHRVGQTLEDLLREIAGSGSVDKASASPTDWVAEHLGAFGTAGQVQELRTSTGQWLQINQRCLPNGSVAYVLIDISEERKRHKKLRQQEELFRELASLTTDWFWQTDKEHRFSAQLGREFDPGHNAFPAVLGHTRFEIATPEDRAENPEKWAAHKADLAAHLPFNDYEYEIATDNGTRHQLRVSGRPHFGSDGAFLGYRGVARNVSEEVAESRRADEARQRLRGTLEALPLAVGLFDRNQQLVYCNQGYRETLQSIGGSAEAGTLLTDLHNALREIGLPAADQDGAAEQNGRPGHPLLSGEASLSDGRCLQINERGLNDGSLIVTMSDITQLKRQTWQLAEKSSVLQGILDNMGQGLIVFGPDYRVVASNEQLLSLFGIEDLVIEPGMAMQDVVRAFSRNGYASPKALSDGIDKFCESVMACEPPLWVSEPPNGRILDLRRTRMPDGGVAITCTDITEQKSREQAFEQKSAELEVVLETLDQGILVLDGDLRVATINDRMLHFYELPPDLDLNTHRARLSDLLRLLARSGHYGPTPLTEEEVEAKVAHQMEKWQRRAPFSYERSLRDGTVVEVHGNPVQGGGWVVGCRDITKQRRDERALREAKEQAELASRAKTEFLANTSHELRTPLNAIIGFSDILMAQMFGPLGTPKYLEYVTDIHESGQHLLDLINDLLDLAKVESGRLELSEEAISIEEVFASSIRLMRERADAGNVRLSSELSVESPTVLADQRALKQILLNLLSNAVKFTPAGGTVSLSALPTAQGDLALTVTDSGIGMDEEDIPKALAPFGQIDGSMARRYHGTGLGLPLAQRLAEQHGGKLHIQSRRGQGTTVTVLLPSTRWLKSDANPLAVVAPPGRSGDTVKSHETAALASR